MIASTSKPSNFGRGFYDTTGLPKPPAPQPQRSISSGSTEVQQSKPSHRKDSKQAYRVPPNSPINKALSTPEQLSRFSLLDLMDVEDYVTFMARSQSSQRGRLARL